MARNIPLFKEKLDQLDQRLSLTRLDRNDYVYVLFHMGTDIANGADMIDRFYGLSGDTRRSRASFDHFVERLDLLEKSRLSDAAKITDHPLQAPAS